MPQIDERYKSAWDESYRRQDNTLFYPCEEIIRFVNRYIRRRIGPSQFTRDFAQRPRCLDLGSGAGRHLKYLHENGFHPIGVDLSSEACEQAMRFLSAEGVAQEEYELHVASSDNLPFPGATIDFAVSHGTLDSMPAATAQATLAELRRVLTPGALLYLDMIAPDATRSGMAIDGADMIVSEEHERGTVQSYFDRARIEQLVEHFEVVEITKTLQLDWDEKTISARWHLILRNRG